MPYLRRYNFLLALLFVILVPFGAVQAQGITVTVQVQATLHNGPGREFAPLGGVSPNTTTMSGFKLTLAAQLAGC